MESGRDRLGVDDFHFDIKPFLTIIHHRTFNIQFLAVLLIFLFVSIFSECVILGLCVIICYYFGAYTWNLVYPFLPSFLKPKKNSPVISSAGCHVCGIPNCGRQKPTGEHQPWIGLDVPRDVDQALQDLLNKLLNEFVISWFGKFSRDELFLWEIRERLRFSSSVLLRRVLRADIGEIICERLVPIFLRHVDDYVAADGCGNDSEKLAAVVLHLGERIHPAARSRHAELEYLRAVSRTLSRLGLYQQELKCKPVSILLNELLAGGLLLALSDTLCSPDVINMLLWIAAGTGKLQPVAFQSPEKVQFLKAFASKPHTIDQSVLHKKVDFILKDQKMFYALMEYLKERGVVHLLTFYLEVEEFNKRLLVPEISAKTAKELFKSAWELYNLYLKPGAPDHISCSPGVSEHFLQLISRGDDNITSLQTSTPLFQAYEETYSLLEQTYLPGFYQSKYYFKTLCTRTEPVHFHDSPTFGSPSKTRIAAKKIVEKEPLVSKLSQKIKRLVSDPQVDNNGLLVESACDATELDCTDDLDAEFVAREMSNWKISIPDHMTVMDSSFRKYDFCVIRVTAEYEDDTTEVKRKFEDFYTLESKLIEFHQKLIDTLPPKRSLFDHDLDRRCKFLEAYLRRLIKQPELKYSHLLFCFLRGPGEFQTAMRSPLSLASLLRRSVEPMKMRRERGRHLDSLLAALLTSIETHSSSELLYEISKPQRRDIKIGIFGDNLAPILEKTAAWPPSPARPVLRLNTFWDCLFFTMSKMFGCAPWLQRLIFGVKSALGDAGTPLVHNFINNRLEILLLPRLPYLIRLLQGAILSPPDPHDPNKGERLRIQVTEAITKPVNQLGQFFIKIVAPNYQDAMETVIESLQHPTLNKHLFYCLLDEILKSLFTEFSAPVASLQV